MELYPCFWQTSSSTYWQNTKKAQSSPLVTSKIQKPHPLVNPPGKSPENQKPHFKIIKELIITWSIVVLPVTLTFCRLPLGASTVTLLFAAMTHNCLICSYNHVTLTHKRDKFVQQWSISIMRRWTAVVRVLLRNS